MLEEIFSLLFYVPLLVPMLLLFIYAFAKSNVTNNAQVEQITEDLLIEKDH
ncbi:MAG TPA: hypothetical protein VEF04_09060 [Blastocatellia bacterium]|nr:hypothetical protein [Blastocatellia bacterium]